jgi:hypothetical protein
MKLIEKEYYTLQEVTAAWEMPRHDVAYLAETDRMRLTVRVCRLHIERGEIESHPDCGWHTIPHEQARYTGLLDITAQDAQLIMRNGSTEIQAFHAPDEHYCHVMDPSEPVTIHEADLLIRAEERARLEQVGGKPEKVHAPELFSHDISYQHVTCGGRRYRFGKIQARIIRQLHQASMTSQPWCKGSELIDKSQSRCYRLVDVFKSQQHWRELIESDGRGSYKLAIPPQ